MAEKPSNHVSMQTEDVLVQDPSVESEKDEEIHSLKLEIEGLQAQLDAAKSQTNESKSMCEQLLVSLKAKST